MKCPVCKEDSLLPETLEGGLPAAKCCRCNGIWISFEPYEAWLNAQTSLPSGEKPAPVPEPAEDVHGAKLCPECGRIMPHYRILPEIKITLEHCGNCGGIWFDKDEYAVFVSRDLSGKFTSFFTREWQADLRAREARKELEQQYQEKFGPQDYARIKEIRAWLLAHTERAGLLAYLQSDDPYASLYPQNCAKPRP